MVDMDAKRMENNHGLRPFLEMTTTSRCKSLRAANAINLIVFNLYNTLIRARL